MKFDANMFDIKITSDNNMLRWTHFTSRSSFCPLWLKDDLKVKVTVINGVTGYMDLSSSLQMCYKHHLKRTLHYNLCSWFALMDSWLWMETRKCCLFCLLLVVALGPETWCLTQSKCHLQSPGDPPIKPHSFWHFGRDVLFNHLFKSYEADKDKLNNSCRLSLCPC